ncbi:MAG: alkyl/aryl-sulfatase [Pseudomonadota bacterium]
MHPELESHPDYFTQAIVPLADNVYQAFGFAASNVYLIVGDDGVVIIDTSESTAAAEAILAAFRKITKLPVETILLTHSHRDHVSGASVFAEGGEPEILCSEKSSDNPLVVASAHPRATQAIQARTRRQFGFGLPYPEQLISLGVGPATRPLTGMGGGILPATRRIGDEGARIRVAGIELELAMAPGETPDHMVVWYPEKRVLFSGDNFYRAFPNLYAIRGTEFRDFDTWADSLDTLMAFEPEVLAPGHTKALFGADTIRTTLTDYRDAIRHVVTETRNGMDAGLTADELAHRVHLPPALAEKPYLREFYGRVDHAVRAYCVGTLGWFDGNPTSLNTLAPAEEAARVVALAGGADAVRREIDRATADRAFQWALELVDRLLRLEPDDAELKHTKADLLRRVAHAEINCPTRNYCFQCAKELERSIDA